MIIFVYLLVMKNAPTKQVFCVISDIISVMTRLCIGFSMISCPIKMFGEEMNRGTILFAVIFVMSVFLLLPAIFFVCSIMAVLLLILFLLGYVTLPHSFFTSLMSFYLDLGDRYLSLLLEYPHMQCRGTIQVGL